jgi:hypothetical protein
LLDVVMNIVNVAWPIAGLGFWVAGAATLQMRAKDYPIDLWLSAGILTITVVAFHLNGYLNITLNQGFAHWPFLILLDASLIITALFVVRTRMETGRPWLGMAMLVVFGALAFWAWFLMSIGGLAPK